jgi:hypothetical protein
MGILEKLCPEGNDVVVNNASGFIPDNGLRL